MSCVPSNAGDAWQLCVRGADTEMHVRRVAQHGTVGPSNAEQAGYSEDRLDRSCTPGVLASMDVN
jgi:hypothetical protein